MSVFDPIDPNGLTIEELQERIRLILALDEQGATPDQPTPPGYSRCYVCRRISFLTRTLEEAMGASEKRFGYRTVNPVIICGECDLIISRKMGMPPGE